MQLNNHYANSRLTMQPQTRHNTNLVTARHNTVPKQQHHAHSRLAKKLTHFHEKTQLHLHTTTPCTLTTSKETNLSMKRQHYHHSKTHNHHAKPQQGNTPCKDNANSSLDHSSLNLSLDTHLQTHGLNTLIMKLSCKEHNTMHTQH